MKRLLSFVICSLLLSAAVGRPELSAIEKQMDRRFTMLFDEPMTLLSATRGYYVEGMGAIFSAELQIVFSPNPTPFGRPTLSAEELQQLREKKLKRLPDVRGAMLDAMASAASGMKSLPDSENIVVAVSLLQRHFENNNGLPAQIVMRGVKKDLLTAGNGASGAALRTRLQAAVQMREY
jgi:hypothetical protein